MKATTNFCRMTGRRHTFVCSVDDSTVIGYTDGSYERTLVLRCEECGDEERIHTRVAGDTVGA